MWRIPEKRLVTGFHHDQRGYFTRLHDSSRDAREVQSSAAFSRAAGTFRGLHFLRGRHSEEKRVRVLAGSILDFGLDIRLDSPSYGSLFEFELRRSDEEVLIPKHFAHGYLTLEDNTLVTYVVDEAYVPSKDAGFRFDDKQFDVKLPITIQSISARDANLPIFKFGDGEERCNCCPTSG